MNMENTTKKLVAYYRVSSKRQKEEGVSIEAQQKLIRDYCKNKGYELVEEFTVDESAKTQGRKTFKKMIEVLNSQPDIEGLACEKVDRLLRGDSRDKLAIEDLVNLHGKKIHLVKESSVLHKDSKSGEKFMFDIKCAMARWYINNLSEEVKKSYDVLIDDGFYPHVPPLGYNSKLDEHIAIIDPAVAPFIKRAFDLCATGEYSEKKISQILFDEGFRSRKAHKVGKSAIGKILHTHFYYGYFEWKDKVYRGNHDPIISKDLFEKVQEVLSPKKKRGYKHDFAYVGLMKCGECGNGITAETQKGHVYYRCTKPNGAKHCSQKFVREEVITEQLEEVIKAVSLGLQKIKVIKEVMSESLEDESEYHQQSLDALNTQYNELQTQSSKLLDLYIKEKIKEEAYNNKSVELDQEIQLVNTEILKHKGADKGFHQEIEGFLAFCNQAPALFKGSSPALKRELLRFVVSNLILKDKIVQFSLKTPFDIVAKYSENENWQGWEESNFRQRFWRPLFYH
jgi:site-specific DNA recombinase